MILMSMGRIWRNNKSVLSIKIRNLANSKNVKEHLEAFMDLKPIYIKDDKQWEAFVKMRTSAKFEAKSKKFRAIKAKQILRHTTSRMGFARLGHKMAKAKGISHVPKVDVWTRGYTNKDGAPSTAAVVETLNKIEEYKNMSSNIDEDSLHDDALAYALGPERNGRVRGLGFGATPSKVALQYLHKSNNAQLKSQVKDLQKEIAEFKTLFSNQMRTSKSESSTAELQSQVQDLQQELTELKGFLSTQMNTSKKENQNVENAHCKILDWMGTGTVLAEGVVASTDPLAKVHHTSVGPDCWKVWVKYIVTENAFLYRPTSEFRVLDDAIGSTIAWPKKYILVLG